MLNFLDIYGRKNKILRLPDFKKSESQIKEEYYKKTIQGLYAEDDSAEPPFDISKFVRIGTGSTEILLKT